MFNIHDHILRPLDQTLLPKCFAKYLALSEIMPIFASGMSKNLYIISGCNGAGKTTASYTVLPEILDCKEFVNAPSGRAKDEFFRSLQEDTFPILYGVYYLETGSYPENHKQILERYPSLDCADFIETITGIIDKVDSMEE